jgi:hypothetical protein
MKMKKLPYLVLPLFFIGSAHGLSMPFKETILLGSIALPQPLKREIAFPVLYKGNEYEATVEMTGDAKMAHFELHTALKPKTLFLLATESLALPNEPNVKHLTTSPDHEYRLFKLTLQPHELNITDSTKKESVAMSTWQVEELNELYVSNKPLEIPDITIILFTNPHAIKELEISPWVTESNIMRLPTIVFNIDISPDALQDLAAQMKLALMDFKFLHKKMHCTTIPFANNRIISMPVTNGRVRV